MDGQKARCFVGAACPVSRCDACRCRSRAIGGTQHQFDLQVFDARTGEPLTEPERISADLDAKVESATVVGAVQGDRQRVRIVRHLAAVISGWLGTGEDQRRTFSSLGR